MTAATHAKSGASGRAEGSEALCEVAVRELEGAGCLTREADGFEILLVHTSDGPRVYSGICPHLGGPLLRATVAAGTIRCPWHHYEFDARDGRCMTIPGRPWRRLPGCAAAEPPDLRLVPLPFEVRDGWIRVLQSGVGS